MDEHIANQIAAGEVVERPASVVKELVENAIDAGAERIDIEIGDGGVAYIHVVDNGSGIAEDDCETAFLRHATSKISSGSDLFRILSLGFRGEALPSIAAVSKLECLTSSRSDGRGKRLFIEGGAVKLLEDAASSRGTDIRVSDLFFNTPARLKYMRTVQTELSHISDYVYRISLAHPEIAITLAHNGNVLLQTTGDRDLLQVIAAIYGTTVAKNMTSLEAENADYRLSGYVSKPEMTRSNRTGMTFVVNGRTIRNYSLTQAVMQAYHTLLPLHRFPLAVIHVQMDPTLMDVNVHPNKLEVRFSKEQELNAFLQQTVKQALKRNVLIPEASKPKERNTLIQEQLDLYRADSIEAPAAAPSRSFPANSPPREDANSQNGQPFQTSRDAAAQGSRQAAQRSSFDYAAKEMASSAFVGRQAPPEERSKPPANAAEALLAGSDPEKQSGGRPAFPKLFPIGQMKGTYILAQNEDGLYMIDQHAAHERINYEYYYELFGNPAQASQELVVPIPLEFTPSDALVIKNRLNVFEQAGVYMEPFGGNTFIIRALPHWIPPGSEREIAEDMAEWVLSEKQAIDIAKLREKSAILCSCKASIKANDNLTLAEMEALLDRLGNCRIPYTCPHGRPIVVSISNYELEKMFKRVM